MVLEESINLRGWLLKRSKDSSEWKKSFFVLQNNILVYYHSLRDNIPEAKYELTNEYRIVDYGVNDGIRQFSLYRENIRVLWLATEDNKARYWISMLRSEIKKSQCYSESNETISTISIGDLVSSDDTSSFLKSSANSKSIPSYMKELSTLLHSSSLNTTLTACENGYLEMTVDSATSNPYKMISMNLPIEVEYAAYFLLDCEFTRMLWDPLFMYSKEIDRLNSNNSIYRMVYKPLSICNYPCTIQSYPRDFCLHRHFSYEEETNTFYILFAPTTHPHCPPTTDCVRGDLRFGYRIEAVRSGVSRITMLYSLHPQGYLNNLTFFCNQFEHLFTQSLPGLRDVLSQIPDYHVLNLIERIVKGLSIQSDHSSPKLTSSEDSVVTTPYITNTISHASKCEQVNNCWEEVDGTIWNVRGKDYSITKEKVQSARSYCKLLCVDLFRSDKRINHIASYPESAIHKITNADRVLIVNLQITGNISVVSYFAIPKREESSPTKELLDRFIEGDRAWRDARFKLLPHIVEGGYFVKKAVGMTPCIIGTKGESSYYSGIASVPYLECDYDMDGSTMARTLSKYLFTADNMVIELGFVIQGVEKNELPEQVLGGFRFYHLDINNAKYI